MHWVIASLIIFYLVLKSEYGYLSPIIFGVGNKSLTASVIFPLTSAGNFSSNLETPFSSFIYGERVIFEAF